MAAKKLQILKKMLQTLKCFGNSKKYLVEAQKSCEKVVRLTAWVRKISRQVAIFGVILSFDKGQKCVNIFKDARNPKCCLLAEEDNDIPSNNC